MAQYIGLGRDEPLEDSERKVADALKKLSDDWTVFHHVSWQSKRSGKQGDGEADFLVFHPHRGILVIEVKGGGIQIDRGRWFTTDRFNERHPIKNPFEQAVDSKYALISWLRQHGLAEKIRVGHAVFFPHMQTVPLLGLAGPDAICLTKNHLTEITASIETCFAHWALVGSMTPVDKKLFISLLSPTLSVSPSLSSQSDEAEKEILQFTAEQVQIFSGLRATRGGLVLGAAGTGKTVLAIARTQQLVRDGFRTLLVCYNDLLGLELSKSTGKSPYLTACTYHSLCLREANRAKLNISGQRNAVWWETEAPQLLIDACLTNDSQFDAIVVDEGQDFSPTWFDSLRCLISSQADAPFFVFADPLQDVWKRNWLSNQAFPFEWNLTRNLRNTAPIASKIASAVNITFSGGAVEGPKPTWHLCNGDVSEGLILTIVEKLLDEGFAPSQLVVLCGSSKLATGLRERTVGSYSFGNWGTRGIVTETISRYKGLEAQAVVLVLSKLPTTDLIEAYVGMSRARSMLIVIGSESARDELKWGNEPT